MRDHSKVIWRTVVFAGAMLGAPACGGKAKPPEPTPANAASADQPAPPPADPTADPDQPNPCNPDDANPCGDRPRGSDDEEGGIGRGFILS